MKKKEALFFDEQLWALIHEQKNNKTTGSLQALANYMNKSKGFKDITKQQVGRALDRLQERGKIERIWNGLLWVTTALVQVYSLKDMHTIFVDEKPILADKKVIRICNYFILNNLIGKARRVSMKFLAKWFDIEERYLRKIVERINFNGFIYPENFKFDYIIVGDFGLGGYFIAETEEEGYRYLTRYEHNIFVNSRKARILRHKLGLHNQMSAKLKEVEEELVANYKQELQKIETIGKEMLEEQMPAEKEYKDEEEDDYSDLPF